MFTVLAVFFLAIFAEIIIAPLSVFGIVPFASVIVALWFGYRLGPLYGFSLILLAGFLMSFFSLNPLATLLSYCLAGFIAMIGISITGSEEWYSKTGSVLLIAVVSWIIILVSNLSIFPSLSTPQTVYIFTVGGLVMSSLWLITIFSADPKS